MKFIHLADLHLGRQLHGYALLDIQKELLAKVTAYIRDHDIKVVVIAGDVYDRAIPSQEAVTLLSDFLSTLILDLHVKVLMIAGNHDGADRLDFTSSILEKEGLYICANAKAQMPYVEIEDVKFYLLPFIKPSGVHQLFAEAPRDNYHVALAYYLDKQDLTAPGKKVLVTHQFVGHHAQTSDSELTLSVGGTEVIDPKIFESFDYVALGHLHAPQYVGRETIRYSGSLAKYSFDEAHQKKGFLVVDTKDFSSTFVPLKPSLDVRVLKGSLDELIHRQDAHNDDLLAAELSDEKIIPHAIDTLRTYYPHILSISYPQIVTTTHFDKHSMSEIQSKNALDLFIDFYRDMTMREPDKEEIQLISTLLEDNV